MNTAFFVFRVHIFKQTTNTVIKIIGTVFLVPLAIRLFIREGHDEVENFHDRFSNLHCKIIFFNCV